VRMKREIKGEWQIVIATILGGFIPILFRFGEVLGVYVLTFARIFMAALFLGFFFLFTRSKLISLKHERFKMILFGIMHGLIILGYFTSLNYLTISATVLLFSTYPIWMVIFSKIFLKEKISSRAIFAILVSFMGVIIIASPERIFIERNYLGPLAILVASFLAAGVYVMSKTFKSYDKVSLTFWQNMIAIPFVLPLLLLDLPKISNPAVFGPVEIGVLLLIGSLFTAVPFVLIFKGLGKIKAHRASVYMFLEILTPIVLAFFIFKEIPSSNTLFGGVLILLGVYMVSISK
jgi:drug/metabolite transporter (DMT)-like permease